MDEIGSLKASLARTSNDSAIQGLRNVARESDAPAQAPYRACYRKPSGQEAKGKGGKPLRVVNDLLTKR
jgi:hypothetical protein